MVAVAEPVKAGVDMAATTPWGTDTSPDEGDTDPTDDSFVKRTALKFASSVGVHSPEFTFEEDPAAIAAAAEELGVTWPIALDTRRSNFFGWQGSRGYWPRTYVIDQQGRVRFDHIGEGKYEQLAATVEYLLTESA